MTDILNGCLEQIKKTFYFYFGAITGLYLSTLIKFLNYVFNESEGMKKNSKILDFEVDVQYFSLIYGLLFFLFIIILRLQVHQLKESLVFSFRQKASNKRDLRILIRFFPMLASPFRDSLVESVIFWISILIGLVRLIPLIVGHALGSSEEANYVFKGIAVFDGAVFIVGCYLLYKLWKDIVKIRAMVRAKNQE